MILLSVKEKFDYWCPFPFMVLSNDKSLTYGQSPIEQKLPKHGSTVFSKYAFLLLRLHKTKYIIIKTIVQGEIIPIIKCHKTI